MLSCGTTSTVVTPDTAAEKTEEVKTPARIGNAENNAVPGGSPTSVMAANPVVEQENKAAPPVVNKSAFSSFFCFTPSEKYTPDQVSTTGTATVEPPELPEEKVRREQATTEIVRRMMEGWTIMEDPCPTCGIPLMIHHGIKSTAECPIHGPPAFVPVVEAPAPPPVPNTQVLLSVAEEEEDIQPRNEKASAEIGISGVEESGKKTQITLDLPDNFDFCDQKSLEKLLMQMQHKQREAKNVQITLDLPGDFDFGDQKSLETLLMQMQRKQKQASVCKDIASASTKPVSEKTQCSEQPQQQHNATISNVDTSLTSSKSLEIDGSYPGAAEMLREGWTMLNHAQCDCGGPLMRSSRGCRSVYCVNMLCPLSIYQNAIPLVDEEEFAPATKSRRARSSKVLLQGPGKSYRNNMKNKPLLCNPIMEEGDFDSRAFYERNNSHINEFPIGYIATDNNPGMEEASQLSGDTFTRTVTSEAIGVMLTRIDSAKDELMNPTGNTQEERLLHQKEMAELIQSLASAAERIKSLDPKK